MDKYIELNGRRYVWRQFLPLGIKQHQSAEKPEAPRIRAEQTYSPTEPAADATAKQTMLSAA